jgi:hypothetical protein
LAGAVKVSILALERLSSTLAQTLPMLDLLRAENSNTILQTTKKIGRILDEFQAKTSIAFARYQEALSNLEYANRYYEYVPDFYYRTVNDTLHEYNRLQQCCTDIKAIQASFSPIALRCEKSVSAETDWYSGIVKKSESFLAQFSELLKQSVSIFGVGESAGNGVVSSDTCIFTGSDVDLSATRQTWIPSGDGTSIFDSPVETGAALDANQGKVAGFGGTCGLVSCVNVLRMAGKKATEQEIVTYASRSGLCSKGDTCAGNNGGTHCYQIQAVLSHYGVSSELRPCTINNIAIAVSEGRGVIALIDAGKLWNNPDFNCGLHAITITSVKKDFAGNILGFYVCDSGTGGKDKAKYYSASSISDALTFLPLIVTSVIR